MNKIKKSIVASGGSTIKNSRNEVNEKMKKVKTKYSIIGFLVGVISSILSSYLYDLIK